MTDIKQVIVMRKDLKMRRGKEIAQGSHASMAWLTNRLRGDGFLQGLHQRKASFTREEIAWIEGNFKKITLQVDSEEALIAVYEKALSLGLTASLITDAGLTEFNGVPTKTCLAIGPNLSEEIDKVTADLQLY